MEKLALNVCINALVSSFGVMYYLHVGCRETTSVQTEWKCTEAATAWW